MDLFEEYSDSELKVINIQFLGLKQKAWEFSRGMRLYRDYMYPDDDTLLAVKDEYSYTMDADNRGFTGLTRTIRWYDRNGVEQLSKDVTPELNIKNIKTLNREVRQGRIDYMVAAAEELAILSQVVPEPFATDFLKASNNIDVLLKYYEIEINHYIQNNRMDFDLAINNEANAAMIEILGLMVRPPDALFPTGLTIKQSIMHQLTGSYS